ncbi:MAG: DnaT-like ssDNA-binding protein [Thermodesulfobacteriota bacterium]
MTIIIEDGSGVTGANSYVSVASATAYLNSKGLTTWGTSTTTAKEVSLNQATLYMELLPWKGAKALQTYPLAWPRRGMLDRDGYSVLSDTIPQSVKYAQIELAYRYKAGKNPLADISSGDGYVTKESVGPIEIDHSLGYSTSDKFPEIDRLLEPFLSNAYGVVVERC